MPDINQDAATALNIGTDDRGGKFILADFDANQVSALTAEQRGTLSAQLIQSGFDKSAVEKMLTTGAAVAPNSAAPVTPGLSLDPWKHPVLSEGERQSLGAALRPHWTGDPDVLERAIGGAGTEPAGDDAKAGEPDQRTDAERIYDSRLGGLPPEKYDLNGIFVNRSIPIGEMAAIDTELRDALSAMRLPTALGRGIAEELLNTFGVWQGLKSDAERELYWAHERVVAARAFGQPYETVIKLAREAVQLIPAKTARALAEKGAFDRASVLVQLARHGERLQLRQQMAQRRQKN